MKAPEDRHKTRVAFFREPRTGALELTGRRNLMRRITHTLAVLAVTPSPALVAAALPNGGGGRA
jgi:hypothetical protein